MRITNQQAQDETHRSPTASFIPQFRSINSTSGELSLQITVYMCEGDKRSDDFYFLFF